MEVKIEGFGEEAKVIQPGESHVIKDSIVPFNVDLLLKEFDTIDKLLNIPEEVWKQTYLITEEQYEAAKGCDNSFPVFLLVACSVLTFRCWISNQKINCEENAQFLLELRDLLSKRVINAVTAEKLVLVQTKLNLADLTKFGFEETTESNWFECFGCCVENEDQFFFNKDIAVDWSGWNGLPGVFKVSVATKRAGDCQAKSYYSKWYLVIGELKDVKDFLTQQDGVAFRVEQLATINSHHFAKILPIKNATKQYSSLRMAASVLSKKTDSNYLVEIEEPVPLKDLSKYTKMSDSTECWFLHTLLNGERYARIIVCDCCEDSYVSLLVTVDLGEKFPEKLLEEKLRQVLLLDSKEPEVLRLKEEIAEKGIFAQNSGEMDSFTD